VGNLWWLGFRVSESAAPGSTLDWSLLNVERVVNPSNGVVREEYGRTGAQFVLEHLEREYTPPSSIRSMIPQANTAELRWVANGSARYLLRISSEREGRFITLIDTALNIVGRWPSPEASVGALGACVAPDGRIILAGLDTRAIIDQGRLSFEKLEKADRTNGYRLSGISSGCRALMGKMNAQNPALRDSAIIDFSENRVISEFSSAPSSGRLLLFANGTRLLEQEVVRTAIPNSPGFRVRPTSSFKITDTSVGRITLRRTLNVPPAYIHDQLLCQGESERVAIQAPRAIHLLNLNTLSVIATTELPFEQYFVIGSAAK
jgi:hypothetical protein